MVHKQFTILVIFVFTNSAICSKFAETKNGDVNQKSALERIIRGQYNFNHPPSVEYYNPIPVAVVYEEDEIPKGKTLQSTSSEPSVNYREAKIKIVDNDSETTLDPSKIRTAAGQSNDKNNEKIKLKSKPLVLNDYQIPVFVIYDTEADASESYKRVKYSVDDKIMKTSQPQENRQQHLAKEIDTLESQNKSDKVQIPNEEKNSKPQKRTRERPPVVPIIESENYVYSNSGDFHYSYEGGDGTKAFSRGELRRNEDDETGEAVVGGFSYKDKDGNDVSLSYTADQNGYRPVGAHLPTPPPIPPAIARALRYLATVTTPESVTEPFSSYQ